jgi:phenylalanyl-tRNA synthetase beta subunit
MNPILHRQGAKDPALEILGYYGIRIPTESGTDPEAVSQALRSAVLERQSRLQGLSKSTESSIAAQVAESVNSADGELQTLMGAVFAYTPYSTVHLADSKVKQRLEHLDHDIEKLGDGIKRLDVNRLAKAEQERLSAALGGSVG